jgi:hypothetical protein
LDAVPTHGGTLDDLVRDTSRTSLAASRFKRLAAKAGPEAVRTFSDRLINGEIAGWVPDGEPSSRDTKAPEGVIVRGFALRWRPVDKRGILPRITVLKGAPS